jgi:hypothetical protein
MMRLHNKEHKRRLLSLMLQCVALLKLSDVSQVLTASITREMVTLMMEAVNVSQFLPDNKAQHPIRQPSSYLLP